MDTARCRAAEGMIYEGRCPRPGRTRAGAGRLPERIAKRRRRPGRVPARGRRGGPGHGSPKGSFHGPARLQGRDAQGLIADRRNDRPARAKRRRAGRSRAAKANRSLPARSSDAISTFRAGPENRDRSFEHKKTAAVTGRSGCPMPYAVQGSAAISCFSCSCGIRAGSR